MVNATGTSSSPKFPRKSRRRNQKKTFNKRNKRSLNILQLNIDGMSVKSCKKEQLAKTLKEHPQFKEIGIRQNLCKSDREILKASVQEMKRLNNERNEEDQQLFFWSIRNLRPKKIWKDQSHTESREIRQTARP